MIVHFFPVLGVYIRVYGSPEGIGDKTQARTLNDMICKQSDDDAWQVSFFHATTVAWWIAEYSGFYGEDQVVSTPDGVDVDEGMAVRPP